MPASTRLPHYYENRMREAGPTAPRVLPGESVGDAINRNREAVEVALDPDIAELDITYEDRNLNQSTRRIKPLALTALASAELALIATCRLRDEQRCFAVSRIIEARFPGFPAKPLTGEELMEWLEPDVRRLVAHDATINGVVIRPARPYQELIAQHALADMEISETAIALDDLPVSARTVPALLTSLGDAVDGFAKSLRTKGSRKKSGVTVTMETRDGALRIYVDTSQDVAQQIRDGSNHARMAYLGAKASIQTAAADFYKALAADPMIGHPDMAARVVLQRGGPDKTTGLWLAIDGNWINLNPNAATTLATKLRSALGRMQKSEVITPMGVAPPEWMLDTTRGVFRVRAPRAEEVVPRLMAYGVFDTLDVLGLAQVIDPARPVQYHSKYAA